MSAVQAEEKREHVQREGFGHRLKQAREARGLELMDVANALHLTRAMVTLMEEEDHGRLPAPVFVRGYLRNYARLVGAPVDAILEAYHEGRPKDPLEERQIHIHRVKDEMRSSHAVVRFVSWAVALGILILLGVWWWGWIERNGPISLPSLPYFSENPAGGDARPASASTAPLPMAAPAAAGSTSAALPLLPTTAITVGPQTSAGPEVPAAATPASPQTGGAGEAPVTPITPLTAQAEPVGAAPTPEEDEAAAEAAASGDASGPSKVVLLMTGPSWIDVRDATGKSVLFGQFSKGQRHEIQGTPPFKFHLGKASVVQVTVSGAPFDLGPHTNKGVARFTIDPRP